MPHHTRRARLVLASAVLPLALAACGTSAASDSEQASDSGKTSGGRDPGQLVVAIIPAENSTSLEAEHQGLIKLLSAETGKKVVIQKATNYAAVIEAQRSHKVDIGFYGPLSYVVAKDSGVGLKVMATPVTTKGGSSGYQSYGIVKSGSPVKDLKGFAHKKVCFVDPNSTSGYLYPKAALAEAGVDPAEDITPVMSGGHDASVLSVNSGQCDVGFAEDSMVDHQLIDQGKLKKGDLRVVWKSAEIPGSPVAVSDDLTPALQKKITDAFQQKANTDYMKAHGFCKGDGDCLPDGGWGYVKVTDAAYASVREVCKTTRDKQCQGG